MPTTTAPTDGLTDRQRETLDYIIERCDAGQPPTIREIVEATGVSVHAVQLRLRSLHRKGWITWEPGRARTLTPILRPDPAGAAVTIAGERLAGRLDRAPGGHWIVRIPSPKGRGFPAG